MALPVTKGGARVAGRPQCRATSKLAPWVPRGEAYIGVLVDDLVTLEHGALPHVHLSRRISPQLREDNADLRRQNRSFPQLVGDAQWSHFVDKRDHFASVTDWAHRVQAGSDEAVLSTSLSKPLSRSTPWQGYSNVPG